jgi:hypothetical protein
LDQVCPAPIHYEAGKFRACIPTRQKHDQDDTDQRNPEKGDYHFERN